MKGHFQNYEYLDAFENFVNTINSPYTEISYKNALKLYLEYHKVGSYDSLLKIDKDTTFRMIRDFIVYQRKTQKRSLARINVFFSAIRLFYSVNNYPDLNWYTLARYKGKERRRMVNDRIYTKPEIQRMLQHADLRMKVVIFTMLSSGIRVGGLAGLKLKDLIYLEDRQMYQITVYSDSPDAQYYTFTTPECSNYINIYLEHRQNQLGERLTPNSPLIRKDSDSDLDIAMNSKGIQQRIRVLMIESGIRIVSDSRIIRSEIMCCHGFRKYFNTVCIESDMNIVCKELLMGHKQSLGLEKSYYRPTSDKILNEYLKVVNDLTINDENRLKLEVTDLKTQVQTLQGNIKSELQDYIDYQFKNRKRK